MLVEPSVLLAALRLPAAATVDVEPLGYSAFAPERVAIRFEGGERLVVLRGNADPGAAMNHIAIMDRLTRTGFSSAPKLLAVLDDVAVEEAVEGVSALSLLPPPGSVAAAVGALAGLHQLPLANDFGWERSLEDALPADEVPLHRLGFAANEREAARAPLESLRDELRQSPVGFMHGDASAENVLLGKDRAWLVDFGRAGFGCQLFDLAAFLLTCGLEAPARRVLAMEYAHRRGLDPGQIADLADGAGIVWGIGELLRLPRRQIETMGDEAATEAILTAASRIQRGIRASAGDSRAAAALRRALWPE